MEDEKFHAYHDWAGLKLGNTRTCEAQGFFYSFGTLSMYTYNAALLIYYLCAIGLKMQEKRIIRFVEPLLHIASLGLGLTFSVPPLFSDLYNPSDWEAWCTSIPVGCFENDEEQDQVRCFRGYKDHERTLEKFLIFSFGVLLSIIVISFTVIIVRVIHDDRVLNSHHSLRHKLHQHQLKSLARLNQLNKNRGTVLHPTFLNADTSTLENEIIKRHSNAKVIIVQCLCYVLAFALTLTFPAIQVLGIATSAKIPDIVHSLELVFLPLQGLFNFVSIC
jgi:hypothetical protein